MAIFDCFFSIQIFNRIEVGKTLSVDTIKAYLKKKFPKANAGRILGVDSSYDDNRKVMLLESIMCSITKKIAICMPFHCKENYNNTAFGVVLKLLEQKQK